MKKEFTSYVVCSINYITGKVVLMLNFGLNFNSVKIEEYSFPNKRNYEQIVDNSLLAILDNFIQENSCKQAQFYVVVDDVCVGTEFITIPYVAHNKAEVFIKTELERLYPNFNNSYSYTTYMVNKTKKNVVYKCSLMKKDLINNINNTYKKLGVTLHGITSASCAYSSIVVSSFKLKQNSYFILDILNNKPQLFYMYKNQLMATLSFNGKASDIESSINAGQAFNTDDAIYEIYFFGQSAKTNFGVQLDISGEPLNKKKIIDKQRKSWQNCNARLNEKENAFYPLAKVVNCFNKSITQYGFPVSSTLYLTRDMRNVCGFDTLNELTSMDVKIIDMQKMFQAQICDYIYLFGAIHIYKDQQSNVFLSKQSQKKLFFF